MLDNLRGDNVLNPVEEYFAMQADDEELNHQHCNFLSNGIKFIASGGDFNGNGNSYIYMAFAESPFKYSNAR